MKNEIKINGIKYVRKEELKETKKTIQIKNKYNDEVIYETEAETIKEAVERAVKEGRSLSKANLSEANLSEADLSKANLSEADLSEAYLSKAYLSKANLSEADLSEADLSEADLSEANLSEADLSEANLSKANLCFCKMDKKVFKEITEGWFEWKVGEA